MIDELAQFPQMAKAGKKEDSYFAKYLILEK